MDIIQKGVEHNNRLLPPGRCACHESTVKWCGRHGKPLKLIPGERVMLEEELSMLYACIDNDKAGELAALVRRISAGKSR